MWVVSSPSSGCVKTGMCRQNPSEDLGMSVTFSLCPGQASEALSGITLVGGGHQPLSCPLRPLYSGLFFEWAEMLV